MGILEELVEEKRKYLKKRSFIIPISLPEKEKDIFFKTINLPGLKLIAEIKPSSPVKGKLLKNFSLSEIAEIYDEMEEVSCISVLTAESFSASLMNLQLVRKITKKPILQKDFIITFEQVYEGRILGADAILLIARILSEKELENLYNLSKDLNLEPIIEIYEKEELEKVLPLNPRILMINNRNLDNFQVNISHTLELLPYIPKNIHVISASGIKSGKDVEVLYKAGVKGILVGESIVSSSDPKEKIKELLKPLKSKIIFEKIVYEHNPNF
ncbi:MAG: indole-3-glycerol-phosphate synthase [Dictyoglomus sp.]|nr:indole-3-glycerol-phosphate synthase [Dictyoglomus sp.]MCX7942083.1 indole-3-glycerol-phosphate synthase [Dictyoglomaceae bacterium]MDW8187930.1 indole-3-glycerol-phosphate synthase [Dictyoglomus sp.]